MTSVAMFAAAGVRPFALGGIVHWSTAPQCGPDSHRHDRVAVGRQEGVGR
jgi:hypothetical protein